MSAAPGIVSPVRPHPLSETGRLANIVTTAELLAAGFSAGQVRASVRTGSLIRLGRGVYAPAELARPLFQTARGRLMLRAAAALTPLGSGAAASHHTAATILGLDLLGRPPAVIALTRASGSGSRRSGAGTSVHIAQLPPEHIDRSLGLPLTSAARTVADLARASSFRAGVVVADSALRRRLTTGAELAAVAAGCRKWPGSARAAAVAAFASALAESPLESISRVAFRDCGLPRPELQVELGDGDRIIARVDFYWDHYRTVAEADGEMKYDNRFEATYQLRRDARLRDAGYEVVHFGWSEIYSNPGQVAASIRAAFRRAGLRAAPPGPAA